ncbi:hypothetical protein MMC25_006555 [Agyrium rufum]|nr:hypothetical protein [Agyrium rufum]
MALSGVGNLLNTFYTLWSILVLLITVNASPFSRPDARAMVERSYTRAVFAHYLVGTITQDHARQDIDDAKAMSLDGFALNIGDATQAFVDDALHDLFGYAENVGGFKLFISMDVSASGASCNAGGKSCNGPFDYASIFDWTLGSSAYYLGPNGFPMISTFSSGGLTNDVWTSWKESLANQMYFIPDFDETGGYYGDESSIEGWYDYWGPVVDGVFSWESAWPQRGNPSPGTVGGAYPGDIGPDLSVQAGAIQNNKGYMMGLSSLQYKDAYGSNVFRPGDLNLVVRIENILNMSPRPSWIIVQTWNDGPESHYIGNLWPEQNTDPQPAPYTGVSWSHIAWQPLIQAFIDVWKGDGGTSDMSPSSSSDAQGALWYRTMLMSATCANDNGAVDNPGAERYYEKPDGYDSGTDGIDWAVLMPPDREGYSLSIWSGDKLVLSQQNLSAGLNYGTVSDQLNPGVQTLQVFDAGGNMYMTATGGQCVSDGCPDLIYNMNYQVVPLSLGMSTGSCGN